MSDVLSRVLASYDSARRWMAQMHAAGRLSGGRAAREFESLEELAAAVEQGEFGFGDLVSVRGWLSLYASWYLPSAYSPYHLAVEAIVAEPQWMVKTSLLPALLPAGQLPFGSRERTVGFLYPSQTRGFVAELLPDDGGPRFGAAVERESSEDNPWVVSLDTGNAVSHPTDWSFTLGDSSLEALLNEGNAAEGPSTDDNSEWNSGAARVEARALGDPALVRRAARVPRGSQPIPIVFPPNFARQVHSEVEVRARIAPLDAEVLAELSRLGQPLTDKAFALFSGGQSSSPPFCLRIETDTGDPTSMAAVAPREVRGSASEELPPSKTGTLMVEWYFEDPQTGLPVPFGDEELLSWFIPCAKNYVVSMGNYLLPSRWAGKLYGFDGPLYFFQTGTVGFTMSPEGFFTATQQATFGTWYDNTWRLWKDTTTRLQRELIEKFRLLHGRPLTVRTTYLTDWNWIGSFGNVLEGRAVWTKAQETLREGRRDQLLIRELQSQREAQEEKSKMRPIKVLFVASNPIDTDPLQTDREIREVKERIKLARHRDLLVVEQVGAPRPQDLLQAFNEHEVDIFHFSGHGSKEGELGLCALDGTFHPLKPEALSSLMRVLGKKVQVAVINACYSHAQAEAITAHIPCAIGMNDSVADETAIAFAAAFYSALAFGHDVQTAYEQGIVAVQLENLPDVNVPELLLKEGVDASQIRPVQEQQGTSNDPQRL